MYSLLYVSSASIPFSSRDLQALLDTSRANNHRLGVTGMLLFKGGNFMQLLEGDEAQVTSLYKKISTDPRHSGTMILLTEHNERRAFGEWSMAFRDLNDPAVLAMEGFNAFLNTDTSDATDLRDPTRAQRLLNFFKHSMR